MNKELIFKQYEKIDGQDIKVELYYDLGGRNYYTGKHKVRGYYISVQPIEITDLGGYRLETYSPMEGAYKLVLPVKRKSKKAEAMAEDLMDEAKNKLIKLILSRTA